MVSIVDIRMLLAEEAKVRSNSQSQKSSPRGKSDRYFWAHTDADKPDTLLEENSVVLEPIRR